MKIVKICLASLLLVSMAYAMPLNSAARSVVPGDLQQLISVDYRALKDSQTAFAVNFGAGTNYGLGSHWALRADYRELAAFPSKTEAGLSTGSKADAIWMERGTLGLAYRF